jgi:death-on-curing protein
MAPQQTWGGEFLCQDLAEMAATYWYNLTRNHGFVDGNKRVGLAACDVFLLMNGHDLALSDDGEAVELALQIATNEVTKDQVSSILRSRIRPYPSG